MSSQQGAWMVIVLMSSLLGIASHVLCVCIRRQCIVKLIRKVYFLENGNIKNDVAKI